MSLWGLSQIIDVTQQNKKEKRVQELLTEKGYPKDLIEHLVWCISYIWLSERYKKKVHKKIGETKEAVERKIERSLLLMLRHEDIANVLIKDKRKAQQVYQQAVEQTRDWNINSLMQG